MKILVSFSSFADFNVVIVHCLQGNDTSGRNKDLEIELESAKTKLAEIEAKKSEVARDSIKVYTFITIDSIKTYSRVQLTESSGAVSFTYQSKQLLEEMSYKLQAAPVSTSNDTLGYSSPFSMFKYCQISCLICIHELTLLHGACTEGNGCQSLGRGTQIFGG